ncbi:MAG: response regulator transcription factor [Burkholderiales bacterium]
MDDEDAIRKAVRRLLRSAGLAVQTYASGQEFLQSLPARRPDCVVLDIRMPGMTGFDVQARLKAAHVAVPIIFITALDDPEDEPRAMRAGAAAFLRKPFGDEELLAAIAVAVGSAQKTPPA